MAKRKTNRGRAPATKTRKARRPQKKGGVTRTQYASVGASAATFGAPRVRVGSYYDRR